MDIQRTILWVVFGMSLVFLWDRWQAQQGRPGLLTPPAVVADKKEEAKTPAPAAKSAAPVPGAPAASPAAVSGTCIDVASCTSVCTSRRQMDAIRRC